MTSLAALHMREHRVRMAGIRNPEPEIGHPVFQHLRRSCRRMVDRVESGLTDDFKIGDDGLEPDFGNGSVSAHDIVEAVSEETGVSLQAIYSEARNKMVANARHMAFYIIRQNTALSMPAIGRIMNRDHSTVVSGHKNAKAQMESSPEWRSVVHRVMDRLSL